MELNYKNKVESQNIDVDQLRPNKSYDFLIENRNASMQELLDNKKKMKDFLIRRNCPICGSNKSLFKYKKDSFDIVECKDCMVDYVNPIFNEEKYIEIYQSLEYQSIGKKLGEDSHIYRKNRFGEERADSIEKFHNDGLSKSFLEIGCSTGFVLESLNERGWNTIGLEINPSSVEFGKKRGINIQEITLEKFKSKDKFSAVAMYDVLEHLVNPKEMLLQVKDLLEIGGNIFIYVPNYNSATTQLLGVENAHFIWPTHHLTYFTPESLKRFLDSNGFEVIFWETQGLDVDDWLWYLNKKTDYDTRLIEDNLETFQFYINASGHGKNLRMYAKKK